MADDQVEVGPGNLASSPPAASNGQLPSPALSPIAESDVFTTALDNALNIHSPRTPRSEALSPTNESHAPAKILRLSPSQIHELTSSPGSLPLRPASPATEDIPPLSSSLGSPQNAISSQPPLFSPPPLTSDPPQFSGEDISSLASPAFPAALANGSSNQLSRPGNGPRSATSPLLKRRESATVTRNPKATPATGEGPKSRKPSLTPLKVGDELSKDAPPMSRSSTRTGLPSPMLSAIPLPPLSLPTYLQLELSSDRPSALYIHRPSSTEYPYEDSRVKIERLRNFLRLPHQLEQVLWFGTLACLDSWLYSLTILPLRFCKAAFLLISWWTTSLAKESTSLSREVVAGVRRHWRRKRQGSIAKAKNRNADSSTPQANDVRRSRPPLADVDPSSEASSKRRQSSTATHTRSRARRAPSGLSASHKADLLHGMLIVATCAILNKYDASRMYHSIRGQAAIKLYVIYNVIEVCDRLLSALGQDILECLFSKETLERKANGRSKVVRPLWMFLLALIYNVGHATLLSYQAVTLNVAVNSYSNALLTLLMSNQFVEIKGAVFKKFEKENLFQMTCADIVERFQLWLMLSIIASRNIIGVGGLSMPEVDSRLGSSSPLGPLQSNSTYSFSSSLPAAFKLLPSLTTPVLTPFLIVLGSEMLVDWLKHAYINKFNSVKPAIYGRFLDVLAKDYYSHAFADQNLTKRIGLPTLPLVCLVLSAAVQVWGMFIATSMAPPPTVSMTSLSPASGGAEASNAATMAALHRIDVAFRQAMGRSSFGGGLASSSGGIWSWTTDDAIAFSTLVVFVLVLYLFLLAFKLILGMGLLSFARSRYRGMKEREREAYDTHSRRIGGWGVTEVDEDKRRWIYADDDEGLRRIRERDARDKERKAHGEGSAGLKLERVERYTMAAKRIW